MPPMPRPIAVLIGFAGMFVASGYTWTEVKVKIGGMGRIEARLKALEVDARPPDAAAQAEPHHPIAISQS